MHTNRLQQHDKCRELSFGEESSIGKKTGTKVSKEAEDMRRMKRGVQRQKDY